jgi:hypothetical protein
MAVTRDEVWVASSSVNHVVRLDAKTNQPGTIVPAGLVVGFGSLWIPSCGDHTVVRVDAETGILQTGYSSRTIDNVATSLAWIASHARTIATVDI